MSVEFEYGAPADAGEVERLKDILGRSFGVAAAQWDTFFARIGHENFRRVRRGGEILGGLAIYFMGQWFGGRAIPMAGVAAVGVAPELRSGGAAAALMARTLSELRERGVPLSTLYPATQPLYRKVGYEQAGTRTLFVAPTRAMRVAERDLPLRRVDAAQHEAFHDLYRARARAGAGNLERSQAIWERVVTHPQNEPMHAYVAGGADAAEGYVVFHQPRADSGYEIAVRDLVALTPAAARAILGFFADHRSIAKEITWSGPLLDSLACLFSEQELRVKHVERWMLRIVDVPKALALRGYPDGVEGELHLAVRDEVLPANQGRFLLRVAGGRGEVTPGGRGELELDVRGLAPLYSGLFTPGELAAVGFVEGKVAALAAAARFFAGPEPWMPDFF